MIIEEQKKIVDTTIKDYNHEIDKIITSLKLLKYNRGLSIVVLQTTLSKIERLHVTKRLNMKLKPMYDAISYLNELHRDTIRK